MIEVSRSRSMSPSAPSKVKKEPVEWDHSGIKIVTVFFLKVFSIPGRVGVLLIRSYQKFHKSIIHEKRRVVINSEYGNYARIYTGSSNSIFAKKLGSKIEFLDESR